MNFEMLEKLIRLANNNPNENEANLAARKACKMLLDYKFTTAPQVHYDPLGDIYSYGDPRNTYRPPKTAYDKMKEEAKKKQEEYEKKVEPEERKCSECGQTYQVSSYAKGSRCMACTLMNLYKEQFDWGKI